MNKVMIFFLSLLSVLHNRIFFQNFVMFIAKTLNSTTSFCHFTHQFLTIAKFCFNCSSEPRRNSVFSICPPACLTQSKQLAAGYAAALRSRPTRFSVKDNCKLLHRPQQQRRVARFTFQACIASQQQKKWCQSLELVQ